MFRTALQVLLGTALGLALAAVILLVDRQPSGEAITLRPAPTEALWVVQVEGAVVHPGVYALPLGSRLKDALQAAGGPLAEADLKSLNLARLLQDGERIDVPYLAGFEPLVEATPTPRTSAGSSSGSSGESGTATPTPGAKININYATLEELQTLPGIGPVLAQRIIEYRETYGPFMDVEELLNVKGIGEGLLDRIRDLITVEE